MSHLIGLAVVVCALAVCVNAMAQDAAKVDLRQYSLPDEYLQCTAWTFVAPADWTKEGGVTWTGRLSPGPAYSTQLSVYDATSAREFRLFPTFMFLDMQGPMVAPGSEISRVLSPADCIEQIILKRCRPDATDVRVVWSEVLPQLTRETVALARVSGQASVDTMRVRSSRVLVEYNSTAVREGDGQMEEMVYCTVVDAPGAAGARIWATERTFSYRAPKGRLQESMSLLGTIGQSLKENPQWVTLRRERLQHPGAIPPRTTAGPQSIVDVSRKTMRDQDAFLKTLDGSGQLQDGPILAAGKLDGDTQTMPGTQIGNGYLRQYRDYYTHVRGSNPDTSDFYTAYPTHLTPPQPKPR